MRMRRRGRCGCKGKKGEGGGEKVKEVEEGEEKVGVDAMGRMEGGEEGWMQRVGR